MKKCSGVEMKFESCNSSLDEVIVGINFSQRKILKRGEKEVLMQRSGCFFNENQVSAVTICKEHRMKLGSQFEREFVKTNTYCLYPEHEKKNTKKKAAPVQCRVSFEESKKLWEQYGIFAPFSMKICVTCKKSKVDVKCAQKKSDLDPDLSNELRDLDIEPSTSTASETAENPESELYEDPNSTFHSENVDSSFRLENEELEESEVDEEYVNIKGRKTICEHSMDLKITCNKF